MLKEVSIMRHLVWVCEAQTIHEKKKEMALVVASSELQGIRDSHVLPSTVHSPCTEILCDS